MLGVKGGIAVMAAILAVCGLSASAEANRRCGFDRYGYNPPNFRGCYDAVEIIAVPPPVLRVKRPRRVKRAAVYRPHRARPIRKVVAVGVRPPPPPPPGPPFEGYYASEPLLPGCYFDNGYDMQVHRICYSGW